MIYHENITMYCRFKSEELAQEHIDRITQRNTKNLVNFGVAHDDTRGWHSWTIRKQWVNEKNQELENEE